jgi:hypothetical protein
MLGGQAPFVECLAFDPLSFQQDGLASSFEVDIGGREVAKAPVIALVIVAYSSKTGPC